MKTNSSFNKEKLIFICSVLLLSCCCYYLFRSRPVLLEPGTMVTNTPAPGPMTAEAPVLPKGEVAGFLTGERKNPFQPVDDGLKKIIDCGTEKPPVIVGLIPIPPLQPPEGNPPTSKPSVANNDPLPLPNFDFSAVMTMHGRTLGLLKARESGRTLSVEEGGNLDGFKYTVTKVEKLAIWVKDENGRVYVARDMTFQNLPRFPSIPSIANGALHP